MNAPNAPIVPNVLNAPNILNVPNVPNFPNILKSSKYCRSGDIREVLIFANFARRANSRIQESR